MFANMNVAMRLSLGFGLVLVLLGAITFTGVTRLELMNDATTELVTGKYPKTVDTNEIAFMAMDNARILRNMILLADEKARAANHEVYLKNRASIAEALDRLDKVVKSDKGVALIKQMRDARAAYAKYNTEVMDLALAGKHEDATKMLYDEGYKTQATFFSVIKEFVGYQDKLMRDEGTHAAGVYHEARALMLILAGGALLMALGITFWVTRSITKPLREAVKTANSLAEGDLTVKLESSAKDETGQLLQAMKNMVGKLSEVVGEVNGGAESLASASEQVSATAQALAQAASEQAASVEETSASLEQMTASVSQNTENAKVTDGMASKAAKEAAEGGEAVKQTVSAMKQIAGKIGIIDDIAYQTNLLALNAAIEAARAGEHGKGFAVVAAEVRKLAERSQVAAQEISQLAGGSVEMAEKAGKLLDEIVPSIRKTSDLVQEIAAASGEQSAGVGQLNIAMGSMNQATQQNASSSEELAATAEEMGGQAEQLQQAMSFFRLGGGNAARARKSVAAKSLKSVNGAKKPALSVVAEANEPVYEQQQQFIKF